jgi:hypothetical protein
MTGLNAAQTHDQLTEDWADALAAVPEQADKLLFDYNVARATARGSQ